MLRRPFGDATSGLYAVNAKALPLLAEPYTSGAPEVEALIRVVDAGLRLEEVPVDMAPRAGGESKLRGGKAVKLVLTVVGDARVGTARPRAGAKTFGGVFSSSSRSCCSWASTWLKRSSTVARRRPHVRRFALLPAPAGPGRRTPT